MELSGCSFRQNCIAQVDQRFKDFGIYTIRISLCCFELGDGIRLGFLVDLCDFQLDLIQRLS